MNFKSALEINDECHSTSLGNDDVTVDSLVAEETIPESPSFFIVQDDNGNLPASPLESPPPSPVPTNLSLDLCGFMPTDPAALLIIGRWMDYYPIHKYVRSPEFEQDFKEYKHGYKSVIMLVTGVEYELEQRKLYVRDHVRRYIGTTLGRELIQLIFYFKYVDYPYTKFMEMVKYKQRTSLRFKYEESYSLASIMEDFPQFLRYKFFSFETTVNKKRKL